AGIKLSVASLFALLFCMCVAPGALADVQLITNGKANCAIYVPPEVMGASVQLPSDAEWTLRQKEMHRRVLRDTVHDMAHLLERIPGAKVEIHQRKPQKGDPQVPILFGQYAVD